MYIIVITSQFEIPLINHIRFGSLDSCNDKNNEYIPCASCTILQLFNGNILNSLPNL